MPNVQLAWGAVILAAAVLVAFVVEEWLRYALRAHNLRRILTKVREDGGNPSVSPQREASMARGEVPRPSRAEPFLHYPGPPQGAATGGKGQAEDAGSARRGRG
jgi:hypothetical protein